MAKTPIKVKVDGDIIAQFLFVEHALVYVNSIRERGYPFDIVINYDNKKNLLTIDGRETVRGTSIIAYELDAKIQQFERECDRRMDAKIAELRAQAQARMEEAAAEVRAKAGSVQA